MNRRRFIAGSSALSAMFAAHHAPAVAQGTRLHVLQWAHFVPSADQLFDQLAKEFGKQAGVEIVAERMDQNDIQARVTAAIQSGSLVDVTDVADAVGKPGRLQEARPVGYAGPPGRKATEALSRYVLVDMYAKSIQGMKPEDAVAWATGELKKIYAGSPLMSLAE